MSDERTEFDVLVVGGGPAGMAAATVAAECGAQVAIVDDNRALGGQIWRESSPDGQHEERNHWEARLRARQVQLLCGYRVVDQPEAGVLLAESGEKYRELRWQRLIVATGESGWSSPEQARCCSRLRPISESRGRPLSWSRNRHRGAGWRDLRRSSPAFLKSCGKVLVSDESWRVFDLPPTAGRSRRTGTAAWKRSPSPLRASRRTSPATIWPAGFICFPTLSCRCYWAASWMGTTCAWMNGSKRRSREFIARANRLASGEWNWHWLKVRSPAGRPRERLAKPGGCSRPGPGRRVFGGCWIARSRCGRS